MRYMSFVRMREDVGAPPQALIDAMGRELERGFATGVLVEAGGLSSPSSPESVEIRLSGGSVTRTDGPFAEAKEVAGGYAVLEVETHDQAVAEAQRMIDVHQEFWPGWEGSVELRRLSRPEDGPPTSR